MGEEIELASKAIGQSVGALGDASGVLGPVREFADWVTSFIHYRRQPALAALLMKTAEKVRRTGIPPVAVEDKVLRAILEGASLEDDPGMQERWANLLSGALVAGTAATPPAFADILDQFEPIEARFLDELCNRSAPPSQKHPEFAVSPPPAEIPERHMDNLERLAVIRFRPPNNSTTWPDMGDLKRAYRQGYEPTALGFALIEACEPPPPTGALVAR